VATAVSGADAVVFAAGAGGQRGAPARTLSTARPPSCSPTPPSGRACGGTSSSLHGRRVRRRRRPARGLDDVFVVYLQAKLAAERDVLARAGLRTTVLRPGSLTDDPGTGLVTLRRSVDPGSVPRDDVAAVLVALLDAHLDGAVLELVSGPTPVAEAVADVT
jgi:hypothetical protein